MRRFFILFLCCLCTIFSVGAVSGITSAQSQTAVATDGTCQVALNVTLHIEAPVSGLTFPLPEKAKDITVNGVFASASRGAGVRNVDLSGIVSAAGVYTLSFRYSLPDTIFTDNQKNLMLTLDLLSGFSYPVEKLDFTVTLPGPFEGTPTFSSTYYQDAIDTMMVTSVQDGIIAGSVPGGLKDSEKLTMLLPVSPEMFPQSVAKKWSMDTVDLLMVIFAGFAVLYWVLTMRCLPPKAVRTPFPPHGITPGELGCQLTGAGVDFTMMVVYWAQMGYILIQMDENGRVLLHKRMDMGNERGDFEVKYFRKLFGHRQTVDGTGFHYANLCRKANAHTPGIAMNFRRNSGNAAFFRGICAVIGALSGVSLAAAFVGDTVLRIILSIFLGILGLVFAWQMQSAAKCIHIREKLPLWLGLGCSVLWLLLSFLAGEWNVAVFVIPAQFLSGLAAAYGGRRNEMGRQTMSEILGLRRYLKRTPKKELQSIMHSNPDYFYQTAPWALALGVDRAFADHFGKSRLPQCSYLVTDMDGHLTAREWSQLLRDTVNALDEHQKRLPLDKLLGK